MLKIGNWKHSPNKYLAYYRVCHGFQIMNGDNYFWVLYYPLLNQASYFEAAAAEVKMVWVYKQTSISKFNQVNVVQICETFCIFKDI